MSWARLDQRGNIFEGSRAREYPMPPLHGTGFTAMMADAAKAIGAHPFPGPAAINSRDYQGRSGCMYHGWCDRGGCPVSAKSSTNVSTIPKALATKRLNIVTRAQVTRIEVDAKGRASGVTYLRDGRDLFPAGRRRADGMLHLRKCAPAAIVKVQAVSERPLQQSRPGRPPLYDSQRDRQCQRTFPA